MAARVRGDERQFALILALLATRRGLAKEEIFATVQGYRADFERAGATPALEKRFERDKDELRELGVPLETLDDPSAPGDNRLLRYRIPEGSFELAPELSFDAAETALLEAAGLVWRRGSLSAESARALAKLRALGIEPGGAVLGVAPRLRRRDAAFDPISRAIDAGSAIAFDYVKQGASRPERRRVEPHALVHFGGRWVASGFDLDRGEERRFLLARIVGEARQTGPADPARRPAPEAAAETLAALERLADSQSALVAIAPESDAEVRLPRRGEPADAGETRAQHAADVAGDAAASRADGRLLIRLPYADRELLADELAGYGPEAIALEPPELADDVRERLERVAAAHAPEVAS